MLNVGEVCGVAASVICMAIRSARTRVGRTLALGHTDALHVEVGHILGHSFRLVCGCRQSGESAREHCQTGEFESPHISSLSSPRSRKKRRYSTSAPFWSQAGDLPGLKTSITS